MSVPTRQIRATFTDDTMDPERSLRLAPLPYRSLQVGLCGEAVRRYVDEWLVGLTDVTPAAARSVHDRLQVGDEPGAAALLPAERPYPLTEDLARLIDASPDGIGSVG